MTKEELTTLKGQIEDLRTKANIAAKELFMDGAKDLLANNPGIASFSWTQYTPYWNDGEPCVFSANTHYPDINGIEEYSDEAEKSPDFDAQQEVVKEFLSFFSKDDFEAMFGDHTQVTVNADGVTVEEYSHE
jgi:hypothetical protein